MTGQDIRAFRQRERLSQEALGGVLGVIHSSISNWERGRHIPASHEAKLQELMGASPEGLAELLDGVPRKAEERRKRHCANPVKPKKPAKKKPPRSVATRAANPCKGCPHWQHMDSAKSKTMYCACLQETGHVRTCGVERTYQRYRGLSPLSLDAARAAELGLSYGQYKAREVS